MRVGFDEAGTYLRVVLQEPTICQFLKIDLLLQERIDVLLPDKREVCAFKPPHPTHTLLPCEFTNPEENHKRSFQKRLLMIPKKSFL